MENEKTKNEDYKIQTLKDMKRADEIKKEILKLQEELKILYGIKN